MYSHVGLCLCLNRGMNAVMKEMVDQRKEGGMVVGEEAGDEVSIIISTQGHLLNRVFH